ncbi:pre-mRNA-splicing factor CWC25 homolog [Juglans microcarpa x Juglans regia]|uniref:pre-mRNA-splicing factor CWC25 homolog n=1 Tax=Juglans microcarpa x Juglans regia TaxID=2249226 RepID=UPI001B7DB14E|nr:pre-mRNA-splicing factor CWC25 homolog [Juglans microcarpa x Juglans regia]XP_041027307.1 pre-mRNA-splicing factor CWC25 homolog [Juglans microcarpa x Juglans regia]
MALKFLNKKGWHTGSLRNIENVWKAEQKHGAEQKKLDELRKQIQEERERSEFRLLQEQAGLVPKQERLEFLYDSGLAVGKGSNSDGFKALEAFPKAGTAAEASDTAKASSSSSAVPGALFEEKPHSANDAWRKLHTDPLLMIRQREQEALSRIKNNPVQMANIRKSVEEQKHKKKAHSEKEPQKKHHHSSSKNKKHSSSRQRSDSENDAAERGKAKTSRHKNSNSDLHSVSEDESSKRESQSKKDRHKGSKYKESSSSGLSGPNTANNNGRDANKRNRDKSEQEKFSSEGQRNLDVAERGRESRRYHEASRHDGTESHYKRRNVVPKLSEEERAARLREMQVDAELHEEQRWKRLRKAEEDDAREATRASTSGGRNFLDAAQKSIYGAEKGGSSTIEESVRRRTHYSQGRSEAHERNAFRR